MNNIWYLILIGIVNIKMTKKKYNIKFINNTFLQLMPPSM